MTYPPQQQPPWNTGPQQWQPQQFQQQTYPGQQQQWQPPPGASPQWQAAPPPQRRKPRRGLKVVAAIVGALVVVIVIAAALSSGSKPGHHSSAGAQPTTGAPAAHHKTAPSKHYTPAQSQAIDAAKSYLSMGTGFSRKGLIGQLTSKDGNGFPRKTAVFAVKHVSVNWNHQAVLAAKGYMKLGEGFSCSSLTSQLDSSYGDRFTLAQAQYGAKAVGLCH